MPGARDEKCGLIQMARKSTAAWMLMTRMKELGSENARQKKVYADVQLQNDAIKKAQ